MTGPSKTPKITIVGGGSTHWAPRLLADFANTRSLHDCSVALTDIDESYHPTAEGQADGYLPVFSSAAG